jgi:hypothetical protein
MPPESRIQGLERSVVVEFTEEDVLRDMFIFVHWGMDSVTASITSDRTNPASIPTRQQPRV